VPPAEYGHKWQVVVDTAGVELERTVEAGGQVSARDRSLLVLRRAV
jgi:hypothetical protein